MANDRLMLQCRCGHIFTVAKYLGAGEFQSVTENSIDGVQQTLGQWLTQHTQECCQFFGHDLDFYVLPGKGPLKEGRGFQVFLVTETTQVRKP